MLNNPFSTITFDLDVVYLRLLEIECRRYATALLNCFEREEIIYNNKSLFGHSFDL
jgi:hypothetical protein